MRSRFSRSDFGGNPRPPIPRFGEGARLFEPASGLLQDYLTGGGTSCMNCGASMAPEDLEHEPREIIVLNRCSGCGIAVRLVYRVVDAF